MADAIALGLVSRVARPLALVGWWRGVAGGLALGLASGLAGGRWRGAGGRAQDACGLQAKCALTNFSVSEYSLTMCEKGGVPLRILKKKNLGHFFSGWRLEKVLLELFASSTKFSSAASPL